MKRLIFHVDVNSAFLSWEAAKRVKMGEEDIRQIPSAIGGDRDKRTGVILAKSISAKKYGIKTGEPVMMALRKCPDLYLAKPDFALYVKCSSDFMDICKRYAPIVEKYSIDECFLDMTGTGRIYPDPIKIAHQIKDEIKNELGFTVNIGIGNNKLLAKMASDFEKPDKVHTLFEEEVSSKMWNLPIEELFLVGRASAEKLKKSYIRTIGDLARADIQTIQRFIGDKFGHQLYEYANGIDTSEVLAEREEAKGYSISTTLEDDVTDTATARKILLALADSVSARMRTDNKRAYCVGITIRSDDFKNKSHQTSLDNATDITQEIFDISMQLFEELWDKKTPLRLLGISLTGLTKDDFSQATLFEDNNRERDKQLDKAVDTIRTKYGINTIVRGANYQSELEVGKKYKAQIENKDK